MKYRISHIVAGAAVSVLAIGGLATGTASATISHSTTHADAAPCDGYAPDFSVPMMSPGGDSRPDIGKLQIFGKVVGEDFIKGCIVNSSGSRTDGVAKPMTATIGTYDSPDGAITWIHADNCDSCQYWAGDVSAVPSHGKCIAEKATTTYNGYVFKTGVVRTPYCN